MKRQSKMPLRELGCRSSNNYSLSNAPRNLLKGKLSRKQKPLKGAKERKNVESEKKSLPAEFAMNNQTILVSDCPSASTRCTSSA